MARRYSFQRSLKITHRIVLHCIEVIRCNISLQHICLSMAVIYKKCLHEYLSIDCKGKGKVKVDLYSASS